MLSPYRECRYGDMYLKYYYKTNIEVASMCCYNTIRFMKLLSQKIYEDGHSNRSRTSAGVTGMAELWDIYDENRNLTGRTVERGQVMQEDEYHLVVQIWVHNRKGEWLISKRAPGKSHPFKWEPTGGAVTAGENSLQGALREVQEELGVTLDAQAGQLFASFKRGKPTWENPGFLDVWVFEAEVDIASVRLQEEETCDAKWATEEEILEMIEKDEFIPMKVHPYYKDVFAQYGKR